MFVCFIFKFRLTFAFTYVPPAQVPFPLSCALLPQCLMVLRGTCVTEEFSQYLSHEPPRTRFRVGVVNVGKQWPLTR